MSVEIPVRGDVTFYDMQVVLEDATYTLEFRWNVRAQRWGMRVLDVEGRVLYGSVMLVTDWPLFAYKTGRQPPGALMLLDTSGRGEEPGQEDLGIRHKLLYFTTAELGL